MKLIAQQFFGVLVLASLTGSNALAQREAKVEANLKSLANGETKTGSGPESPGAGLQGTRNELYKIQRSDTLELTFTFASEFNQTVTVQPDGFISLRMVGSLRAAELSVPAFTVQVETAYAGILNQTEVSVSLKDFERPYFLATGEVRKPGKYDLRGDTTVLQATAIAGGLTDKAGASQVILFRSASGGYVETRIVDLKRIVRDRSLAEDIQLRRGDMLFVPKSRLAKIERFIPSRSLGMYLNGANF
jgi:polysaccharide export outer membrane protein